MEFSLLKQIVPNRFYFPSGISTHPTHYPGFDCINPGIGNVAQPYTFFVPTYFQSNTHTKIKNVPIEVQKSDDLIEQDGKGSEESTENSANHPNPVEEISKKIQETDNNDKNVLDELNQRKRKLLDAAIYESFVHPRKIKTESLLLNKLNNPKVPTKETLVSAPKVNRTVPSKPIKHKFKFE